MRRSPAGHPHNTDPTKINDLGATGADDADDFGKSSVGEKPNTAAAANGNRESRPADDLTIPTFLDRRGEACAGCGRPGGAHWDYHGTAVRLHPQCEQSWIDAQRSGSDAIGDVTDRVVLGPRPAQEPGRV
jgi:hypothetical protein